MADLNETIDSSAKSLENVAASAEKAKGSIDGMKESVDSANKSTQEYETSFEKIGATANTALGLISAGLKGSNPALSSMLGSVQQLIPNLTEIGNAAKKSGSLIKGMTSGAGILTLITLVTTLITNFDDIASAIGVSDEALTKFKNGAKEAFTKVIGWVTGVGNAIVKWVTNPIQTIVAAFKKVIKGDFKGALAEIKSGIKEQFSADTYKEAFDSGKEVGQKFADGIVNKKPAVKAAAKSTGKAAAEAAVEGFWEGFKYFTSDLSKEIDKQQSTLNTLYRAGAISEETYTKEAQKLLEAQEKLNESATLQRIAYEGLNGVLPEVSNNLSGVAKSTNKVGVSTQQATEHTKTWAQEQAIAWGKMSDDEKFDAVSKGISSISSTLSSLGQSYLDTLDVQLESGKLSEEEYEKQYEKYKAIQIAETMISTLTGAIDAYKSMSGIPYVGPALGVAAAAAVTAAGMANINQIKNTTVGSSSSSVSTPSVSVPSVSQSYVVNSDDSGIIDAVNYNTTQSSKTQTVLVVDDYNKVANNANKVKVQSSF